MVWNHLVHISNVTFIENNGALYSIATQLGGSITNSHFQDNLYGICSPIFL